MLKDLSGDPIEGDRLAITQADSDNQNVTCNILLEKPEEWHSRSKAEGF